MGESLDISVTRALRWPVILLTIMLATAVGLSLLTGVDGSRVFLPYIFAWASVTLIAAMIRLFVEVARLAPTRVDRPLHIALRTVLGRQQLFILSALIFPAFLGAYTWAKSSIPFVVGYPMEQFWADVDRAILGADAWRLAHELMDPSFGSAWSFFYAVIWGFGLAFTGPIIATFAQRRSASIFFTALMLSWLLGGILCAYLMSAAGPVFAHLADPSLTARFEPLRAELTQTLGPENIVVKSQRALAASLNFKIAVKGGGISAMPSMHIATATIFLLAARGTLWIVPATAFLVLTFFGSVYLGYHYAVDAPVAVVVASLSWLLANGLYQRQWLSPVPQGSLSRERFSGQSIA
jgi:hypothetical protein